MLFIFPSTPWQAGCPFLSPPSLIFKYCSVLFTCNKHKPLFLGAFISFHQKFGGGLLVSARLFCPTVAPLLVALLSTFKYCPLYFTCSRYQPGLFGTGVNTQRKLSVLGSTP